MVGCSARLRTTSNALNAVIDQIIEEHQKSDGGDQSDKKDFVDILLNIQKNGMLDINLTQENIKAILLVSLSLPLLNSMLRIFMDQFFAYNLCLYWKELQFISYLIIEIF